MNQTNQKEPCYEEMKPYEKFMAKGPEYLSEDDFDDRIDDGQEDSE